MSFGTRVVVTQRARPMQGRALRKKRTWPIVSLVLALLAAVFGRVAGHEVYDLLVRPTPLPTSSKIENMLMTVVANTKPTLPRRLDDLTTLTSISYRDKQMTYVYQLDVRGKNAPADIAALRTLVVGRVCASKMKRALDNGFTFNFRYKSPSGDAIGDISLTPADCA